MDENDWLAERFEEQRAHLRAVAYRMLGSLTEADDAVQDTWVRVSRAETSEVENLGGWLTTIVARVCLNMLRSRNVRREESLEVHLPDPVISPAGDVRPEEEAMLADSVGLALLVVLDALTPAERLAFVLHDMFDLPFEEIAPMRRSIPGSGQAAGEQGAAPGQGRRDPRPRPRPSTRGRRCLLPGRPRWRLRRPGRRAPPRRRPAGRLRPEPPRRVHVARGAAAVARQARLGANPAALVHPALVNGTAGVVITLDGRPHVVMAFTVVNDQIVEIDIIADPERVRRVASAVLGGG